MLIPWGPDVLDTLRLSEIKDPRQRATFFKKMNNDNSQLVNNNSIIPKRLKIGQTNYQKGWIMR